MARKPKFLFSQWASSLPGINASDYDKDKFFEQEFERWNIGYNGLTGQHYFYLTQCFLKTITGRPMRPIWRDGDDFVFDQYEKARKLEEDYMIVKRREFGLTSIFGGCTPIYNAVINPGSVNLITSADRERVKNLFRDKTLVTYENLDTYIRPKRMHESQAGYLHFGDKDKHGNSIGNNSQIICRETASDDRAAKSFETYRAMSIFIDEMFLHPRVDKLLASSQACVREGFSKTGMIVMGGSCGVEDDKEKMLGAQIGEKMWRDSDKIRIRTLFLPGSLCIMKAPEFDKDGNPTGKVLNFCENGWSDQDSAKEWILRRRDMLEKAQDKMAYYNFIKQYPLTIEEVFEINRSGVFERETLDALSRQRKEIYKADNPVGRYNIYKAGNGEIKAESSKTGKFYIFSHPRPGEEYIAGIDPIPFGNHQLADGSEYVMAMKEWLSDTYVGYYAERNLDADIVVENSILFQEYYKSTRYPQGAPAMLETNRGEVVLDKYEKTFKKPYLLSYKPMNLGIIYEEKKLKRGWYNNEKTGARANSYLIDYVRQHNNKIWFIRMIDELLVWQSVNTDLVSAMLSCEVLDRDIKELAKRTYVKPKVTTRRIITRDNTGKTVYKWIEIPV